MDYVIIVSFLDFPPICCLPTAGTERRTSRQGGTTSTQYMFIAMVLGSSIAVLIRTSTSMRGLTVWPDWQGQATDGHASMQGQVESMLPTLVLRSSTGHSM